MSSQRLASRLQPDPYARSGYFDECEELLDTGVVRLALFRLNGWPRLPVPASEQAWRPWHRWRGRRDGRRRR